MKGHIKRTQVNRVNTISARQQKNKKNGMNQTPAQQPPLVQAQPHLAVLIICAKFRVDRQSAFFRWKQLRPYRRTGTCRAARQVSQKF
jgi:hypothetical protein